MRILCVCYEYPPVGGGGATACQGLSEALVHAGHEVDVVTSGMKDLPVEEERNGVRIYRVACVRRHQHYATIAELLTQVLPSYRKALALTRTKRYDLNHCHFVVPSGLVSYLLWKRTKLPYILTAHGSDVPGYNPDRFKLAHHLIRPVWSTILRSSRATVSPSHFLEGLIHRYIQVPVDVIPWGFDVPQVRDAMRKNRVLVVTRMFERKGVQYLIQALAQLETDWELWVAGDGPFLPSLKALATKTGVSVKFLGLVPREQLPTLYLSAKVFVFPSSQENFPVVLLEAMAAGCAVVTTSTPGCVEVVGNAAILVKPKSTAALRDTLARLLVDDATIARLSELARKRVRHFAWARIATDYEAIFNRTLAQLMPSLEEPTQRAR